MELQDKTELNSSEFKELVQKYGLKELCKLIRNTLTLTTLFISNYYISDEECKYYSKKIINL